MFLGQFFSIVIRQLCTSFAVFFFADTWHSSRLFSGSSTAERALSTRSPYLPNQAPVSSELSRQNHQWLIGTTLLAHHAKFVSCVADDYKKVLTWFIGHNNGHNPGVVLGHRLATMAKHYAGVGSCPERGSWPHDCLEEYFESAPQTGVSQGWPMTPFYFLLDHL